MSKGMIAAGRMTTGQPKRAASMIVSLCATAFLAACASQPEPKAIVVPKAKPKEYFSEKDYGVKASPKVTSKRSRLKRGGGRAMVGKPYQVKGKWYYPQEMRDYRKTGMASWYGSAFHGRLTANGEIYDMTALSAAHPTMPLPSYARVTNVKNGSSVIVRVNDRGPYHGGRIMDLSQRAAELLDYTHSGTAKIDVEYIGPAPVDGNDDEYLMASYRPAGGGADPSDGLPSGVMLASSEPDMVAPVALVGATPSGGEAVAFPGAMTDSAPTAAPTEGAMPVLPDFGPIVPERPAYGVMASLSPVRLGYAAENGGTLAFAELAKGGLSPASIARSFANNQGQAAADDFVAVGTFADPAEARAVANAIGAAGTLSFAEVSDGGRHFVAVTARPVPGQSIDAVLEAAWAAGAEDAFVVRD